jgi:hypothetical protein
LHLSTHGIAFPPVEVEPEHRYAKEEQDERGDDDRLNRVPSVPREGERDDEQRQDQDLPGVELPELP